MDYKRQTTPISTKGRKVHDPSKAMWDTERSHREQNKSFVSDMEKGARSYSIALQEWNKNMSTLDQEKVDFFKEVTPALTKLIGQDLVTGLKLKQEHDDEKVLNEWRELDSEKKEEYRQANNDILAKLDDIQYERMSMQQRAEA